MLNREYIKNIAVFSKKMGITDLCYKINSNRKRIIAYHNIIPDKYYDNALHLNHSIRESSFKKQLQIMNHNFDFGLDLIDSSSITLTFDDGYLNQYVIAHNIMRNSSINCYYFCTVDLIENKTMLLIDKLQYWFSYVPEGIYNIKMQEDSMVVNTTSPRSRIDSWAKISMLLNEKITMEQAYCSLNNAYLFSSISPIDTEYYNLRFTPITIENINDMKLNGERIGAHSKSHKILSKLSTEELRKDIEICSEMLGGIFNTYLFCYPYGSTADVSQEVIDIVKNAGFKGAFAYCNCPLDKGKKYTNFFMPRMYLPDSDDEDIINFYLSGAKNMVRFWRLLPTFNFIN